MLEYFGIKFWKKKNMKTSHFSLVVDMYYKPQFCLCVCLRARMYACVRMFVCLLASTTLKTSKLVNTKFVTMDQHSSVSIIRVGNITMASQLMTFLPISIS